MIPHNSDARRTIWLWLGPLLFMAVVGWYFVVRYQGQWAEADSATFARVIRAFVAEGRLVPTQGEVYPNGYAFQAISAFILALTGLDAATLQQLVYPLLAALVVLPAWLVYRELTGDGRGATIATMLLFIQPEFLFVLLRSSHEKFTRTLLLLCIFFLARSFNLAHRPGMFATAIGLFYLATFAFIASNNLLAHSFIFAVAVALLLGLALQARERQSGVRDTVVKRLPYTVLICLGLSYLFMFYIYAPVQHHILILQTTWDRIAALFLDVQSQPVNAYAQVEAGWISLPVYFLLSSANWVMLVVSFGIWLRQGVRWLRHGSAPANPTLRLVWLLYAAFALQGGLSVISDASGSLSSNLQHRIFPSFAILGVAMVATELAQWRPGGQRRRIQAALAATIGIVALFSVLKAANEPALSNKWTFYQTEELVALTWSDAHLRQTAIWTEFDERLSVAWTTVAGMSPGQNRLRGGRLQPTTRVLLLTDITRQRSSRLARPLPVPPDALRVYDNGSAELYRLRPQTPYQQ